LLGRHQRPQGPALILLFAKKFFRAVVGIVNPGRRDPHDGYSRMRWTGQIFWLLAYDACAAPHLLPAFTAFLWRPRMLSGHNQLAAGGTPATTAIGPVGSCIQLQQRNCSRFSRDFLRRSTFPNSQRTKTRTSGSRSPLQELFISWRQIADPGVRSRRWLPLFLLAPRKLEESRRVCHSEGSRRRCTESNRERPL